VSTPVHPHTEQGPPQRGEARIDGADDSYQPATDLADESSTDTELLTRTNPENADTRSGQSWSDAVPEGRHGPAQHGERISPADIPAQQKAPPTWTRDPAAPHTPTMVVPARDTVVPVRDTVVTQELPRPAPAVIAPDRDTVLARERDRFGGMKLGSAFFGWLTATGLAVLLLAILTAAGVAFGVSSTAAVNNAVQQAQHGTGTAKTVGLIGAIVLLVILFLSYYCGGYVAARMARFNGVRQGFAVWLWAIITSAVFAALVAVAGSTYNILAGLNLPRIPVKEGAVTTVGLIAVGAAILAALLGALLGGAVGTRYHRRIDAVGFETR
jgi:hypothetical protein